MDDFFLIIPVRNGEGWILEAIDSITQSEEEFRPFEIIVVDDASTDNTVSLLNNLNGEIPITVLQLPTHKNQYYAKNRALAYLKNYGQSRLKEAFIGFLDADDVVYPDRFKRQIQVMKDNPRVWAVGGACRNFTKIEEINHTDLTNAWPMEDDPLIKGIRQYGIGLWNATAIYRWSVINALGSFDYTSTMGDTEWFVRLVWASVLQKQHLRNIQQPVIHRRVHVNQVSNTASNPHSPLRVAYDAMCRQKFTYFKSLHNVGKLEKEHLYRANEACETQLETLINRNH